LDEAADRSVLVARVANRNALSEMLTGKMSRQPGYQGRPEDVFEDADGELAASLGKDFVVLGPPADVRRYLEAGVPGSMSLDPGQLSRIRYFTMSGQANVVTYANDESRVRSFFTTLLAAKGSPTPSLTVLDDAFAVLPYSVTETKLGDYGIDRTTRSPLGQFSSLLPLLLPGQSAPAQPATQPR
jgi:hypothetical protein